ncbi:MAG TPA: DNA polymerase II, partial [Candidatus Atribacteria bacterium]|nr:DNA polymerase II [Candidatus Atribacteria bacterium]
DWCELAQEVQFKVIELILKEKSPQVAVNYLRKVINTLKSQKIPLEKLVIWKTLSKSIDEYEVDAPHVVVAKILRDEGFSLEVGDKVGYIITKGTSRRLADRAKPYFMVDYKDVDVNYYISNQIVPSALRVLSIFDYTEKSIMTQISTKSLDVWFRK